MKVNKVKKSKLRSYRVFRSVVKSIWERGSSGLARQKEETEADSVKD